MTILSKTLAVGVLVTSLSLFASPADINSSGKYTIDPSHSSVTFKVDHLGYSDVIGRFNELSGDITAGDNKSSLSVVIQSASVDTNHDKRDDHLRSPDFFNAKQFPTIAFTSPLSIQTADKVHTIGGQVEMLGVTKSVQLTIEKGNEAKDPWGLYRIGYKATGAIKRSDFGMNFMQGGIGDEIQVVINIEAVKQS